MIKKTDIFEDERGKLIFAIKENSYDFKQCVISINKKNTFILFYLFFMFLCFYVFMFLCFYVFMFLCFYVFMFLCFYVFYKIMIQ